jgi:N-acetylmuramoyl-L-alanine amidase
VSEARRLEEADAALPGREKVLALEESVRAAAVREGAGARASQLYAVAARLAERVWRVGGRDDDAERAIADYKSASRDPQWVGSCGLARQGALVAGERARDASITYTELYRVRRVHSRAGTGSDHAESCRRDLDLDLERLSSFRPAQSVLDAVDQALEKEGEVGVPIEDGGALPSGRPPQLSRVDVWPGRDAVRVVVALDRPASYRISDDFAAGTNPRTFLDLDGVDLGTTLRDAPQEGIVKAVHAESTNTGSRVVLDLQGRAWRRVFTMPEPFRIVVDIARKAPGAAGAAREVTRAVLDPGHGGRDTGAVGPNGVVEKDVTLDIAHRAARALVGQGIEVLLTRDDDRYVPLEERAARANAFSADLFVSIHCNASESRARRGVETYVLDATRDEIAARVAARENEMTPGASAELAAMLGGMRLADQSRRSTQFARLLQRSATTAIRMKYGDAVEGGVHFAGFYVLVGARMPSALFEVSYVSNPVEEERLGAGDYRQLLADALVNAVRAYREGR